MGGSLTLHERRIGCKEPSHLAVAESKGEDHQGPLCRLDGWCQATRISEYSDCGGGESWIRICGLGGGLQRAPAAALEGC